MYISRPNGTRMPLDKVPTLKEAQAIVEGWVQRIVTKNNQIILCNEEGFIKDLETNMDGWELYGHELVGTIVVMNFEEAGEWVGHE